MESLSISQTSSSTSSSAVKSGPSSSFIEVIKKTKKNEPKIVPQLILVDKEAFGSEGGDNGSTVRNLWKSQVNRIIVARKTDTQSIVGYAAFLIRDSDEKATRNKKQKSAEPQAKGSYLMRIGVRARCQRQGIGRKLIEYLFEHYPASLSLDVSTDNLKAVSFYKRVGLVIE
jgi:ribosomal protein S18 acetylase RimI-like enzyme